MENLRSAPARSVCRVALKWFPRRLWRTGSTSCKVCSASIVALLKAVMCCRPAASDAVPFVVKVHCPKRHRAYSPCGEESSSAMISRLTCKAFAVIAVEWWKPLQEPPRLPCPAPCEPPQRGPVCKTDSREEFVQTTGTRLRQREVARLYARMYSGVLHAQSCSM